MNPHSNVHNGVEPKVHNASTYTNWKCRCPECKAGWASGQRRRRRERAERLKANPNLVPHGSLSTYTNWGCRCLPCVHAATVAKRKS